MTANGYRRKAHGHRFGHRADLAHSQPGPDCWRLAESGHTTEIPLSWYRLTGPIQTTRRAARASEAKTGVLATRSSFTFPLSAEALTTRSELRSAFVASIPLFICEWVNFKSLRSLRWSRLCPVLLPTALILIACGQGDWLRGRPLEHLQRTLEPLDQPVLGNRSLRPLTEWAGPVEPGLLDICYVLLNSVPLLCVLLVISRGYGERVDRFLTTLLAGTCALSTPISKESGPLHAGAAWHVCTPSPGSDGRFSYWTSIRFWFSGRPSMAGATMPGTIWPARDEYGRLEAI